VRHNGHYQKQRELLTGGGLSGDVDRVFDVCSATKSTRQFQTLSRKLDMLAEALVAVEVQVLAFEAIGTCLPVEVGIPGIFWREQNTRQEKMKNSGQDASLNMSYSEIIGPGHTMEDPSFASGSDAAVWNASALWIELRVAARRPCTSDSVGFTQGRLHLPPRFGTEVKYQDGRPHLDRKLSSARAHCKLLDSGFVN